MAVLFFFAAHWTLSLLSQSIFHHRYAAHRQFNAGRPSPAPLGPPWTPSSEAGLRPLRFKVDKRVERVMHAVAWLLQGSSYLSPRAYAVLHRMHHARSDTAADPHSPAHTPNLLAMMWRTKRIYYDLRTHPDERGDDAPSWPLLDEVLIGWPQALIFGGLYTAFYVAFADRWWLFVLLPIQIAIGPAQGAIVNYFGHVLGYRNYALADSSRNTLPVDFVTMGELLQNNHHRDAARPNFATRPFELDITYQVMRVLSWVGIIEMRRTPRLAERLP